MTLSVDARRKDVNKALSVFLSGLGEQQFRLYYIERAKYSDVLPTTWTELLEKVWLEDTNTDSYVMYRFTPTGYVQALRISGRSEEPRFREELGKLCKVLKDSLTNRTDFALVCVEVVAKQSGVSEAFVQNAIDADLIRCVLGRVGAQRDGDSNVIRVPHNFGQKPLV